MKKQPSGDGLRPWAFLSVCLGLLVGFWGGCSTEGNDTTGETHFLRRCTAPVDSCGAELECLAGVCTAPCAEDGACRNFPAAQCLPADLTSPTAPQAQNRCDVPCGAPADCAVLSPEHRCDDGFCRAPSTCLLDELHGSEVLLVGDSFFAATHKVMPYLEDLARTANRLAPGESFRDASRLTDNALALGGNGIATQYATAIADSPARIVVMTGGGADALLGTCETADTNCPALSEAALAARNLLGTMASEGVSLVVYAFYPDPDHPAREKVEALRPLIEEVCATSSVPCRWLDLRPIFEGESTSYLDSEGLNPTAAGAQATAEAIWNTLESSCTTR